MKTSYNLRILLAAACLSISTGLITQTSAQETETPAVETPAFSDEKLQSFAVAFVEVSKVQQEYAQKLQATDAKEEQQKLQEEAGGKMMEAVEQADGISVDEYNEVITAAQTDPDLAQRISGLLNKPQ